MFFRFLFQCFLFVWLLYTQCYTRKHTHTVNEKSILCVILFRSNLHPILQLQWKYTQQPKNYLLFIIAMFCVTLNIFTIKSDVVLHIYDCSCVDLWSIVYVLYMCMKSEFYVPHQALSSIVCHPVSWLRKCCSHVCVSDLLLLLLSTIFNRYHHQLEVR